MSLTLATTVPGQPEIFASLQGEGPSAGKPCAFVRLSRCNLACVWCDTAYTWRFTGDNRPHRDGLAFDRAANQIVLSEAETAAQIMTLGQSRLVITGGEPLLQAPALARMIARLPAMQIEVETNGTVAPTPALAGLVHQFNVSPKLSHSGNSSAQALVFERLAAWSNEPKVQFKFVISAPDDVAEVLVIAAAHGMDPARVWLMSEGTDSETLRARGRWLAHVCTRHGFNFSDRLHIHLHGDTRGT